MKNKKDLILMFAKFLNEQFSVDEIKTLQRKVLAGEGLFAVIDILDKAIEIKEAKRFQDNAMRILEITRFGK